MFLKPLSTSIHSQQLTLSQNLRFKSDSSDSTVHSPPLPIASKNSAGTQLKRSTLWIAPIANILAAIFLGTSALLPSKTQPKIESTAISPKDEITTISPAQLEQAKGYMNDLKKLMSDLGWGLSAVGLTAGGINRLSAGLVKKQPSMAAAGLGMVSIAPILAFHSSVGVRTAFLVAKALLFTGVAGRNRNLFERNPGETPRELDMSPLYSISALRSLVPENASHRHIKLARAYLHRGLETLKFIAVDQYQTVRKTVVTLSKPLISPIQTTKAIGSNGSQLWQFLRGTRTEVPDALKPSSTQNQVGACLMYLGGIPMLILEGAYPLVDAIGAKLIAAGTLTSLSSVFLEGFRRKDFSGKAVLVGIPTMVAGTAALQTQLGMALHDAGIAVMDNYFRAEAHGTAKFKESADKVSKVNPQ